MRPPLLFLTAAFGAGLWVGVGLAAFRGAGLAEWGMLVPLVVGAALVQRRAPLAAACSIMALAGLLWGSGAALERQASCAGVWTRKTQPENPARAVVVRLLDPVADDRAVVRGQVEAGPCRGDVDIRWPEGRRAAGGTAWLVAGPWVGDAGRGLLVARTVRSLDPVRRGRGAWRDRIAARSARLFGARAPLVNALVIGGRGELDPSVRERYARAGLAHLLSISGLHVGFLAAWIGLLLGHLRLTVAGRFAASTLLILVYVWLLGFPPPATRAALMLSIDGVARLRQRVVAPQGTIALATLCLLVWDPWAIAAVGAWLSVTAIAAVIWASRAAVGKPRLVRLLLPAAAATLVTAPITALAFGTVAPVGVLANLVAIPLGGLAVPGAMLALVLSTVSTALGALLAAGSGLLLALLDLAAGAAAAVPWGHVILTAGWPAAVAWAGVLAVGWWLWRAAGQRWVLVARLAFATTVFTWASLLARTPADAEGALTIHFLDVGQGDAAVLHTPHGHWIVIDGGARNPEQDQGRRVVVPFLRRHGAQELALVVATHGDADHLGGLPAVLEAFPTRMAFEPGEPLGRPLYLEWLADVQRDGAEWHPARAGDRVEVDGVVLEVLSPDSAWMATPVDVNDHGVVLLVTFGRRRVLFQADAGLSVEARLGGRVGPVDLLKVGHHGSRTATSDAWLDELAPHEAVISVGAHNTYGHPSPEVVRRLEHHGSIVLRTDHDGTITWETDGQTERTHPDLPHHD